MNAVEQGGYGIDQIVDLLIGGTDHKGEQFEEEAEYNGCGSQNRGCNTICKFHRNASFRFRYFQEEFSATVRLKTGCSGVEVVSTQK